MHGQGSLRSRRSKRSAFAVRPAVRWGDCFMRRSARVLLTCFGLATLTAALGAQKGPAPGMLNGDPQVLALACAPTLAYDDTPTAPLRVMGGQDVIKHVSHAPGDLVTINAGAENGIQVGQEFYVRRILKPSQGNITRSTPGTVRTTGWLRIYAVDPTMSLATVTHACETIDIGDYLEPFALPTMPVVSTEPLKPEKDNYARVAGGTDRRRIFAK